MDEHFISTLALKKAIIHCAKYSGKDVYGVLVGESQVSDAIPLFHTRPTAPITEAALMLLSQYNIVGFYESRIRSPDTALSPSPYITSLCNALKLKGAPSIYALCIENDWEAESPFALWRLDNKGSNFTKQQYGVSVSSLRSIQDYLIGRENIVDFDDHFSNPNLDWRNLDIQ